MRLRTMRAIELTNLLYHGTTLHICRKSNSSDAQEVVRIKTSNNG